MTTKNRKALALISGGLDSMLAAKVVLNQGIAVEGIYFFTGFVPNDSILSCKDRPRQDQLAEMEKQLGIPIHRVDVVSGYKAVVYQPKHGFGSKQINPCLDCKIFMVKEAFKWMEEQGFDFLVTGEVIGQRPMSQRRDTLHAVMKESSVGDRLLRPLCAKCLPPTLPEREGWVDREGLYGFNGRSRKPQLALAKQFGFTYFPVPGNDSCFLIDPNFARRWIDFKTYHRDYRLEDIALLKVGRHLRLNERFKIIMGRDEPENNFLQERYAKRMISLYAKDFNGPFAVLGGRPLEEDIAFSARIITRFGKGRGEDQVAVVIQEPGEAVRTLTVKPVGVDDVSEEWYL